ncbi:MAG: hypothetical protein ACOCWQ_05250 [Nanoarchaeota archaeon]
MENWDRQMRDCCHDIIWRLYTQGSEGDSCRQVHEGQQFFVYQGRLFDVGRTDGGMEHAQAMVCVHLPSEDRNDRVEKTYCFSVEGRVSIRRERYRDGRIVESEIRAYPVSDGCRPFAAEHFMDVFNIAHLVDGTITWGKA